MDHLDKNCSQEVNTWYGLIPCIKCFLLGWFRGDRPGELMQEPFLVYLPLPMSVGYSSQGDGLNTAPSPQDKIEIGQYLTPYTASCLFEVRNYSETRHSQEMNLKKVSFNY